MRNQELRAKLHSGVLEQLGASGDESGQLFATGGDQDPSGRESGAIGTQVYPAFATTQDVAGIFRVHPKTVERWRKRHKLPCLIVGGSVRYDLSDVFRWASARKEGTADRREFMNTLAGWLLAAALAGQADVLADTTLAFHHTPGVWSMLLRVDCETLHGMAADIIAPSGKNLCPHPGVSDGRSIIENQCDCWVVGAERGEGDSDGWSVVHVGTWNPMRGPYRIRVRGLLPCKIRVSAGAKFSNQPHWAAADTLRVGPDEEYVWTARWRDVAPGDSTRVKLKRVSGPRRRL